MSTSVSLDHPTVPLEKQPPTRTDHRVEKPRVYRVFYHVIYFLHVTKRQCIIILTPLLLSVLPLAVGGMASKGWYIFVIMVVYWIFEVFPIAITALLPLALAPAFRIQSSHYLASMFGSDQVLQLFVIFSIPIIMERWQINRRLMLHVTRYTGAAPRRLLFIFMVASNVIASLTQPRITFVIAQSMLIALTIEHKEFLNLMMSTSWPLTEVGATITPRMRRERLQRIRHTTELYTNFSKAFVLGVGYATNMGRITSISEKASFYSLLSNGTQTFGLKLDFRYWIMYATILNMVLLIFAWGWLIVGLIGLKEFFMSEVNDINIRMNEYFLSQFTGMSKMNFAEGSSLAICLLMTFFNVSYDPPAITGWSFYVERNGKRMASQAPLLLMLLILTFVWPVENPLRFFDSSYLAATANPTKSYSKVCSSTSMTESSYTRSRVSQERSNQYLMEWQWFESKYPWTAFMMVGAMLIHQEVIRAAGLSGSIVALLKFFKAESRDVLVTFLIIIAGAITEVFKSHTVGRIMMEVIGLLANCTDYQPAFLFLTTAVMGHLPFVLPASSVYLFLAFRDNNDLTVWDLIKTGLVMKLYSIIMLSIFAISVQSRFFDFGNFKISKGCKTE